MVAVGAGTTRPAVPGESYRRICGCCLRIRPEDVWYYGAANVEYWCCLSCCCLWVIPPSVGAVAMVGGGWIKGGFVVLHCDGFMLLSVPPVSMLVTAVIPFAELGS